MIQNGEKISQQPSDILRIIPNWEKFFSENAQYLQKKVVSIAQGGTIDAIKDHEGRLTPIAHPITIELTGNSSALEIVRLFQEKALDHRNLGDLYNWTSTYPAGNIPWQKVEVKYALRISSFDSGQELNPHFLASIKFLYDLLQEVDVICLSGGTDSLAKKVALCSVLLSSYLIKNNKKIIFHGSPESGYKQNSLAVVNITGGLYTAIEEELPGGAYTVTTSKKEKNKQPMIHILPGLGTVKLHSDGFFYSPNSTPLLTIDGGNFHKYPLYDDLKERIKYIELFPDFSEHYLTHEDEITKFEHAMNNTRIETVENDIPALEEFYKYGFRIFLIKARGSGTASPKWKKAIEDILRKKDTTVLIITLADQGDVDLQRYSAGLSIKGVLSGRTLREDAAFMIAALSHELIYNHNYKIDQIQELIERYCWLAGIL